MIKQNNTSRFIYLDNGSGILICFMVLFYHLPGFCELDSTSIYYIVRNIFDFFMAWFFFKSGMCYKNRSIKEELSKCWSRLLFPFIVINLFCFIIYTVISDKVSLLEHLKVSIYKGSETMCSPLWFCLSLFITRVIYQLLKNRLRVNRGWILSLSIIIAFLLYLFKYNNYVFLPCALSRIPPWVGGTLLGLFFYGLGDLMRDKQYNSSLFFIATPVYLLHLVFPYYLDFYTNFSDNYFLSVFFYIAGILMFNNILKRWLNKSIIPLTHIGINSMIYYVTHWTFFYILFVIHHFDTTGWPLYIAAFILTILYLIGMDFLFRKTKLRVLIGG